MPLLHELDQHRQVAAAGLGDRLVELVVHQVVDQRIQHHVLGNEDLEPVLQAKHVLDVAADALPGGVAHPVLLGLRQAVAAVAVQQQADA